MNNDLKDIEKYLRESGFIDKADKIKVIMDNIDGNFASIGSGSGFGVDEGQPADDGGGYNYFEDLYKMKVAESESLKAHIYELQDRVNKYKYLLEQSNDIHSVSLRKNKDHTDSPISQRELIPGSKDWNKDEQNNVDMAAMSNGIVENSVTQHGGFGGLSLSDSYFYRQPGSIEDNL